MGGSPPPPRPRSAMGHRRVEMDEVELSSDSESDSEDLADVQNQPVYPAPRNAAAEGADDTLQLGCWDGNVLAELDDFLGVLDKEEAEEGESSKGAESSGRAEVSSRDGSKRKQLGSSSIDEDEPFGFGATDVDQSIIPNVDESVIGARLANVDESIIPSADESVMPTVEESVIAGTYDEDAAPRMPCPPPAKRQKAESDDNTTTVAAMPPHRRRRSQLPGSSVSSSRSSHYSTGSRGSSMFSSGRLSRAGSTFNGSAASVISNPFDEPSDPGLTRRDTFSNTSPPEILLCCLSKALMKDPVVAADGYTYERDAILEWRGQGKLISPMTQEAFGSDMLIVNQQIKKQLAEYQQQQNPGDGEMEKHQHQQQHIEIEVVPSALDCGILVPSEKTLNTGFGSGFAPMGGRAPMLSRPGMAPPSQPRGKAPGGGAAGRGRRGSKGNNSARGANQQQHQQQQQQQQQPQPQAQNLDCAILVPSDAMACAIPVARPNGGFAGMRGSVGKLQTKPSGAALPMLRSKPMPAALDRPGSGGVISEVRRAAALDVSRDKQLGVGPDFM